MLNIQYITRSKYRKFLFKFHFFFVKIIKSFPSTLKSFVVFNDKILCESNIPDFGYLEIFISSMEKLTLNLSPKWGEFCGSSLIQIFSKTKGQWIFWRGGVIKFTKLLLNNHSDSPTWKSLRPYFGFLQ